MSNEILATLRDIIRVNPLFQQHVSYFARRIDVTNPYALADFAASLTTADAKELQDVLETTDLEPRLQKALLLLKKEHALNQLQATIKQDVEKRIDKQQRTYFLMEQLKTIKKELGLEKDDKVRTWRHCLIERLCPLSLYKAPCDVFNGLLTLLVPQLQDALVTKFQERVAALKLPATAKAVFDEELEKLQVLERNSSEFNVTRTYLDWLTSIPWGKYSQDNFDISLARGILDEDHYGMQDVKGTSTVVVAMSVMEVVMQHRQKVPIPRLLN